MSRPAGDFFIASCCRLCQARVCALPGIVNVWFWDIEWAALIVMVSIAVALVAVVIGNVTLRQTRNATARSAVMYETCAAGLGWEAVVTLGAGAKGTGRKFSGSPSATEMDVRIRRGLHVCTLEIRPFADAAQSYPNEAVEFSYVSDLGSIPSIERWNRVSVSKQDHGVLRLSGCVEILDVAVDRH